MRTEDDIRDAFATSLERHALDREAVVARFRDGDSGRSKKSRSVLLVAVAAATAAAAVVVPVTLSGGDGEEPPVAAATGMWRELPFTLELPQGWQETGRTATADLVQNGVSTPSQRDPDCFVTAFRPGRFDTGRIGADREPVTINGKPGFYAVVSPDPATITLGKVASGYPAVVWQYATDAWVLSQCPGSLPDRERTLVQQLAEAATFAAKPFPVPVKLGYLSPGFETANALAPEGELLIAQMSSRGSVIEFTKDGLRCDSTTEPPRGDRTRSMCAVRIVAAFMPKTGKAPVKETTPVTPVSINGQQGWIYRDGLTDYLVVDLPQKPAKGAGYYLQVELPAAMPNVRDELRKIADQVQVAPDIPDQSTWFDAGTALP
jgi:hypothetical protein